MSPLTSWSFIALIFTLYQIRRKNKKISQNFLYKKKIEGKKLVSSRKCTHFCIGIQSYFKIVKPLYLENRGITSNGTSNVFC